jgi:hypothetical protein
MKEFIIKLNDDYVIPDYIADITPKQWESIFESIFKPHPKHDPLLDQIREILNPVVKFYKGSNNDKGQGGELSIRELLYNYDGYRDGVIKETCDTKASGDLLFIFKNLRCLIEIKNKQSIAYADITKFERDIVNCKESINCGLFISLLTDKFPNRSRSLLQIEYIEGVPVIYLYAPPPSNEIHYAISYLDNLLSISIEQGLKYTEDLRRSFVDYYTEMVDLQKYFNTEVVKKGKELKYAEKKLDYYNKVCLQLGQTYIEVSNGLDLDNKNGVVLSNDDLAKTYIEHALKNTLDDFIQITDPDDIDKIKTHAIDLFLSSNITPQHRAGVIKFIDDYERSPTKKELIAQQIFTDYSLRKLHKVINKKNFIDDIIDHCLKKGGRS